MKTYKKLTSIAMAGVLMAGFAPQMPQAFADGAITMGTESAYNADHAITGHTYKVYQLLTGDVSGGKLINLKAGKNFPTTKYADVNALTDYLNGSTADKDKAYTLADQVTGDAVATLSGDNMTYQAKAGYYVIVDASTDTDTVAAPMLVQVLNDGQTIKPKADTVESHKNIKDNDDADGNYSSSSTTENTSTGNWQDVADYSEGQIIPFQLTGTLPGDYNNYETYYYEFVDQASKGLTIDTDSAKVYLGDPANGGTLINNTAYTFKYGAVTDDEGNSDYAGGNEFHIVFNNLKTAVPTAKAGDTIYVEYNAKLNSNALSGVPGNPNRSQVVFSHNPKTPSQHGKTPWDNNIVFTYDVVVNKTDDKGAALEGATFELKDKDGNEIKTISVAPGGKFEFKHLDVGDYELVETKTPDGYNPLAGSIKFSVNDKHEITWDGTNKTNLLHGLTGPLASDSVVEVTLTPNDSTGTLSTDVVNKTGVNLPSFGGMGTTIFYIAGGVLVLTAAGAYLYRRRKQDQR